jgi:hypothetical protein
MGEKLSQLIAQPRDDDDQVILMTHCGPSEVGFSGSWVGKSF